MSSYRFVKQRAANTYALEAQLTKTENINRGRLATLLHNYGLTNNIMSNYAKNLIPSIFYEKKPPKGKFRLNSDKI
jgi:hypothetical protein